MVLVDAASSGGGIDGCDAMMMTCGNYPWSQWASSPHDYARKVFYGIELAFVSLDVDDLAVDLRP